MAKFITTTCSKCGQQVRSHHGKFHAHYLPKKEQKLHMKMCPFSDKALDYTEQKEFDDAITEIIEEIGENANTQKFTGNQPLA